MTEQGEVMVSALWPAQLERQARIAAAVRGVSRSELIRQAVARFLIHPNGGAADHQVERYGGTRSGSGGDQ